MCLWVIVLCSFIPCVCSCIHHRSQDRKEFHHYKDLSFYNPACLPSSSVLLSASRAYTFPTPGDHESIPHSYNFVIQRILYKWNHAVCNLLELAFFLTQLWFTRDLFRLLCVSVIHSILLTCVIFSSMNIPRFIIRVLKDI